VSGKLGLACMPVNCYSVAPDGQRFFTTQDVKTEPPPPVTHINLVLNWFVELQAKVPSGLQGRAVARQEPSRLESGRQRFSNAT